MDELLNSNTLSEEVRSSLSEAWETQLTEARETITAELREEFATRYENDKSQIVEAMDTMIGDVISKELEEFKEDKAKVAEDRVSYRKHMKEHSKMLDSFVMDTLRKEINELRSNYMHAIYSIMEIRQAIGDVDSKMSHRELVDKIKALYEESNNKSV